MLTRFRCVVCGMLSAGKKPVNYYRHREVGDGTFRYPRWHKDPAGNVCMGNFKEAEWVEIDEVEYDRIKARRNHSPN